MPQKIITNRDEARRLGMLKDGRYFLRASDRLPLFLPIWYGNRLDLKNLELYAGKDLPLAEKAGLPELNRLVDEGKVLEQTIYRKHDIFLEKFPDCRNAACDGIALDEKTLDDIVNEFRDAGFRVTRKAVLHNYAAWQADMKSGYRDERNGYHLFTPCGCNPLSFRATTIEEELDWQETYSC